MDSNKYAQVNFGNGQPVYVRIKKDSAPITNDDKEKLIAWAQDKGFAVSNRKRVLHAE